jgi:hypothetical protein
VTYYEILLHRHPNLPKDVLQAMELYEERGLLGGLERLRHMQGQWWRSVRTNLKRMPLPWDQAVKVLG